MLVTDRFEERGIPRGTHATVIEVYGEGEYEIQGGPDVEHDLVTVKEDDLAWNHARSICSRG